MFGTFWIFGDFESFTFYVMERDWYIFLKISILENSHTLKSIEIAWKIISLFIKWLTFTDIFECFWSKDCRGVILRKPHNCFVWSFQESCKKNFVIETFLRKKVFQKKLLLKSNYPGMDLKEWKFLHFFIKLFFSLLQRTIENKFFYQFPPLLPQF